MSLTSVPQGVALLQFVSHTLVVGVMADTEAEFQRRLIVFGRLATARSRTEYLMMPVNLTDALEWTAMRAEEVTYVELDARDGRPGACQGRPA
jgi:hypothetical protein